MNEETKAWIKAADLRPIHTIKRCMSKEQVKFYLPLAQAIAEAPTSQFIVAAKALGMTDEQAHGVVELMSKRPTMGHPMTMVVESLLLEVKAEIRNMTSPWLTREGAAAYLATSDGTIDRLAQQGKLPRKYLEGTVSPRFHKADLDRMITDTKAKIPFVSHKKKVKPEAKQEVAA